MSYIRWSDDSDVYVYMGNGEMAYGNHIFGVLVCCGCLFVEPNKPNDRYPGGADFKIYQKPSRIADKYRAVMFDEMLVHLEEHKKAGHKVPDKAIERLKADRDGKYD